MEAIEYSFASVIGSYHLQTGLNNQDSVNVYTDETCFVGVVSDGCGSGKNSEVGAKLATCYMAKKLPELLKLFSVKEALRVLELDMISYFKNIAETLCYSEYVKVINDFFLYTVKGVIITQNKVYIFSAGDGYYMLDDKEVSIDQDNKPLYFSYNLLDVEDREKYNLPEVISFEVLEEVDFSSFDKIVISSDGIDGLIAKQDNSFSVLGVEQKVGNVGQFFEGDKYFKNKMFLQKRLNVLAKNKVFEDDTTLLIVRRKQWK